MQVKRKNGSARRFRLSLRRSLPRIKVLLTRAILCNFLYVGKNLKKTVDNRPVFVVCFITLKR